MTVERLNKTDLIERTISARQQVLALAAPLPEHIFAAPSTPELWSAKDHLMHLAVWSIGVVSMILGKNRWEAMGLADGSGGFDHMNELIYLAHKDKSSDEVKSAFEIAHQNMMVLIGGMSEEDMEKPYVHYDPTDPKQRTDPIYNWIAGDGFAHYEEHLPWMEEAIARAK
jgi:hypothetical protein